MGELNAGKYRVAFMCMFCRRLLEERHLWVPGAELSPVCIG